MVPFVRIPLLILLSCFFVITPVPAEPVYLPVFLPLSNVNKENGIRVKNGFLLGIREEVAIHQVPWDEWVTLKFFDTRSEPDHTLRLMKQAIADGAKAILGPSTSSKVSLPTRHYILEEARVPLIAFAGSVNQEMRTTNPLFIRLSRSIPLLSASLARWLIDHPIVSVDKPRWACIHADYAYGIGVCDGFKRFYEPVGEEIGRVPVPLKTVNKKREIVQLAKLKPDFALAVFAGAENDTFYPDYYRFKVHEKIPLVALSAAVTPKQLKLYEKTLEAHNTGVGILTADAYPASADNPVSRRFVAQYQQRYNTPPNILSMWGYDAGRLLVKALVALQGQWDGLRVVHLMKTLPYVSPRHGQQLKFDSHGDVINLAYILKTKRVGNRIVNELIGQTPLINMDELLK